MSNPKDKNNPPNRFDMDKYDPYTPVGHVIRDFAKYIEDMATWMQEQAEKMQSSSNEGTVFGGSHSHMSVSPEGIVLGGTKGMRYDSEGNLIAEFIEDTPPLSQKKLYAIYFQGVYPGGAVAIVQATGIEQARELFNTYVKTNRPTLIGDDFDKWDQAIEITEILGSDKEPVVILLDGDY